MYIDLIQILFSRTHLSIILKGLTNMVGIDAITQEERLWPLPQAGILSQHRLLDNLNFHGYAECLTLLVYLDIRQATSNSH